MRLDDLADLLKGRGCTSVGYFHTDHFEPWSSSIDEPSARAVERMAALARSSSYARRLSLFYSVYVPYRLKQSELADLVDPQVEGDGIVFGSRTSRQEELARDAIRPLAGADGPGSDGHEFHLHVHHEYWTRNHSHFDTPVSRWVNASSTAELDSARLELYVRLCKEAIGRELGRPFERWAFIHGNWALNASDPLICHVADELALLMRQGGFGDFSFPAGRSYCDPRLKTPFSCLPLPLARAYDDPRSDPRPVARGTQAMRPDRFFIWNSSLPSAYSSLDTYSAATRKMLQAPEQVVAEWLRKSPVFEGRLLLKTHAHSMSREYRLTEPGSLIPHCQPDVVRAFDLLAKVCERARLELGFHTVNEVTGFLADLDGGGLDVLRAGDVAPRTDAGPGVTTDDRTVLPPVAIEEFVPELVALHRSWMALLPVPLPADDLYAIKVARGTPLTAYELAVAGEIAQRFPADLTRIVEIGTGWGGLSMLLARHGFEVLGFEGNVNRYAACRWHFGELIKRYPALANSLMVPRDGLFPEVFSESALARDRINVCVATNITHSYTAEHQQEIIEAATRFDELILDVGRFGNARNTQAERDLMLRTLTEAGFRPVERLYFQQPYEYWRLQSRRRPRPVDGAAGAASRAAFPVHGRNGLLFSAFGDRLLSKCPVCASSELAPLWRMPATNLPQPIQLFGGYFNQVPTLQVPARVYCFDFCRDCESIFLNPVPSGQKEEYRKSTHYVRRMQSPEEWGEYEATYDKFAPWIPPGATVMVDAACGIGQYLHIARRRRAHHWRRLIGLELGEGYVEQMRSEGFEAHAFDIDNDDPMKIIAPGTVDFISFCEAFEHVERPLDALRKLVGLLRPGGRIFFTAQRYGTDVQAAVRPGEPIYIGEKLMAELPSRVGCRQLSLSTSTMRYYVVLEKPAKR